MDTRRVVIRTVLSASLMLLLAGCVDMNQKQGTLLGAELPGLGDMFAPTKEEKAEAKWWDDFYGHKPAQTTDIYGNKVSAE